MRVCGLWVPALALVSVLGGCAPVADREIPGSDVWAVDLADDGDAFTVGTPANLTDRDGYDNQPFFLPDGSGFVYASDDGDQIDVWRYRFATGSAEQLTHTPENEYSPQIIPGGDAVAVVRVEDDGDRRLWRFSADGGDPFLLIEWEDDVEYQAWIDDKLVALRVGGDPDQLKFADPAIGWVEKEPIARSVGRTFRRVPGNNAFTFVHRVSSEEWWLRQLDLLTRETFGIVPTLDGVQDFAWTPAGSLLMAKGARLYRHRPAIDEGWVEVANFSADGVLDITRLEVSASGSRLLFVAARESVSETE